MKKILAFLLPCLLVIAALGQDKIINDANAVVRHVGSFHAIRVSNGIQLTIKQGSEEAVAVSADDPELRDRIITEVVDGVLKISFDHNLWKAFRKGNRRLKAYVSFKNIDKLHGSSGSLTKVDGLLTANGFDVDLSSGAEFNGDIKATSLSVDQSSGSTMRISGNVQTIKVGTSSGATFHGYELVSDNCSADASSGGSIQITVNKSLSAEASSGGGIRYKGSGTVTSVSTGSGGSVRKNS